MYVLLEWVNGHLKVTYIYIYIYEIIVAEINAIKYFNATLFTSGVRCPRHETAACQCSVPASQTTRNFFSYLSLSQISVQQC